VLLSTIAKIFTLFYEQTLLPRRIPTFHQALAARLTICGLSSQLKKILFFTFNSLTCTNYSQDSQLPQTNHRHSSVAYHDLFKFSKTNAASLIQLLHKYIAMNYVVETIVFFQFQKFHFCCDRTFDAC